MILRPTPISSDRFTLVADRGLLVIEASDLGTGLSRVWDDAFYAEAKGIRSDVGLTVISTRTGREVVFAVEHEERDSEGELLYTDLHPVKGAFVPPCIVRIFND